MRHEIGTSMSLRLRITLLTAVLIAFTSTIIGIATYVTVASVQLTQIDTSLQSALSTTGLRPGNLNNAPNPRDSNDFPNSIAFAGINMEGQITVARPSGTPSEPDPFPVVPESLIGPGADRFVTFVDSQTDQSYRATTRTLPRGGTLIALTSLNEYQSSLNLIALRTFFIVLASTLFGGLIAWFTVRRSFRPVVRMVGIAGEIAAGNTNQRMPNGAPGTELGVLSESMNSMLESLTLSMQKLEQSEVRLRKFVSDASHEIRTPLTVIRGYAELLVRNSNANSSDLENRALQRINSESLRLERLVTSLLQLNLAQSVGVSNEYFSFTTLVRDSFEDLIQLSERDVVFNLEEVVMVGNEESWAQLLANIAQNISRYTPMDTPVSVHLEPIERNGEGWFILTVDDGGPGIAVENRGMVFDRFTRLDQARDTTSGGFGLGMSIIKSVVLAHQGELTLDDSPLGGLRVQISAPVKRRQS
jgi:two-component system OmpR family sensor kinase